MKMMDTAAVEPHHPSKEEPGQERVALEQACGGSRSPPVVAGAPHPARQSLPRMLMALEW